MDSELSQRLKQLRLAADTCPHTPEAALVLIRELATILLNCMAGEK